MAATKPNKSSPKPDRPSDWAGAHARQQITDMPDKAEAARALIEAAVRLRLLVTAQDSRTVAAVATQRPRWPVLWQHIDAVVAAIEGYK